MSHAKTDKDANLQARSVGSQAFQWIQPYRHQIAVMPAARNGTNLFCSQLKQEAVAFGRKGAPEPRAQTLAVASWRSRAMCQR